VNVGSSSCKVSVGDAAAAHEVDTGSESPLTWDADRWREFARALGADPRWVLHRFVHGGGVFHGPTMVTPDVRPRLDALVSLDPLHTKNALAVLDVLQTAFPQASAVVCFDTSFHETLSAAAYTYAIPRQWREEHGVRKYGFHGFAHDYADRRGRELAGDRAVSRVLSCQLGSGSSLAAIIDGVSIDTTMGFTPLDGLVMSTRSGEVDPGALAWLLTNTSIGASELSESLEHDSGLTALAGEADMSSIVARAMTGDEAASLAYDVWMHRLVSLMGSMVAIMGGIDLVVFSGGVGEHVWEARASIAKRLAFLGLELDGEANERAKTDALVSAVDSRVAVVVVGAREDLAMIRSAAASGMLSSAERPSRSGA
jgi:acetate kinase